MTSTYRPSDSPLGNLFNRPLNIEALLKANDITIDVQRHLVNVYAALASTIVATAFGAVMDLQLGVGGVLTTLAGFGAIIWLHTSQDKLNHPKRVSILLLFGLMQGLSLGRLVDLVLEVDPSILVTALLSTTAVFACFGGAALFAKRRSYLYLGGILSSIVSVMLAASFFNLFSGSTALFGLQLYAGLFVFCGYVIFDTQLIVEKATLGDRDFALHAAELFIDFVGIFVRICIILLRNRESSSASGRDDRRGSRGRTVRR